jgi:salicylate hydroxylase
MGYADCWALFRSLEQSYKRPKPNAPSIEESSVPPHLYDLPRALRLYNETRRHFLGRVELQMTLDRNESAYLAEAEDEEEWIRRFKERHSNQIWLTEHDVEAEFQKTLAGEAHWLSQIEAAKGVKAHL